MNPLRAPYQGESAMAVNLVRAAVTGYGLGMTATQVIEEIMRLRPSEQVEVIQFALQLARTRQLTARELGELADRLAQATDPAEILRLKSAMLSVEDRRGPVSRTQLTSW